MKRMQNSETHNFETVFFLNECLQGHLVYSEKPLLQKVPTLLPNLPIFLKDLVSTYSARLNSSLLGYICLLLHLGITSMWGGSLQQSCSKVQSPYLFETLAQIT